MTKCCDNFICANCDYKHSKNTICAVHYNENHLGSWITCEQCKNSYEGEIYKEMIKKSINFINIECNTTFEKKRCYNCNIELDILNGCFGINSKGYSCHLCVLVN